MNLFTTAALRLTLWYLAIIMVVSIACTLALYQVSAGDLERAVKRQIEFYSEVLAPEELTNFSKLRRAQLDRDLGNLKERLIIFNFVVLAGGGLASYALARKTMQPLEQSLEAQKRFTGDASHELRTPLSVMQTEIEVALRNPRLSAKDARQLLKSNLEEVNRLKRLSEGLLQLAGTSSQEMPAERVLLKNAVKEALDRTAKTAAAKHIKLEHKKLSGAVLGRPNQIADLTAILIDNAVKYSPAGKSVQVTSGTRERHGFISVIDQGAGIAKADLPRIFERFYRADDSRSRNQAEGYGLGLAIAKKIADNHRGYIEVKSSPGKGSTFTAFFPLAKPNKK